jgi:hypothetical protein
VLFYVADGNLASRGFDCNISRFGRLSLLCTSDLVAPALFAAGLLILVAGILQSRKPEPGSGFEPEITATEAAFIAGCSRGSV